MTKKEEHLFKAARDAAARADYSGANAVKIGCVAVYKGTILAKGCNSDRTHPLQYHYNKYRFNDEGPKYLPSKGHSEIFCLSKLKFLDIEFSKVKLFIYREYKDGSPAMARPCKACMAAIKNEFGIKTIYYTTPDGYCKEELN